MKLPVGQKSPSPFFPKTEVRDQRPEAKPTAVGGLRLEVGGKDHKQHPQTSSEAILQPNAAGPKDSGVLRNGDSQKSEEYIQYRNIMNTLTETTRATADAHKAFLEFSNTLTRSFEKTFETQTKLLETLMSDGHLQTQDGPEGKTQIKTIQHSIEPAFDRNMCMEFAVGSVAKGAGSGVCRGGHPQRQGSPAG